MHRRFIPAFLLLLAAQGGPVFTLRSNVFHEGADIPTRYTCEGDDASPPLVWTGVPAGTKSLALIVDDPDAPDPKAPKTTWVHWVLYDIPATIAGLDEAADTPKGAREGLNDWKKPGWGGPCPPVGTHRYFFKLYALDAPLGDLGHPTKQKLEEAMKGHVLGEARLMGRYAKNRER